MRMRAILGALVLAALPVMPVLAENMTPEEIKKLVDEAVEQRLQEREHREGSIGESRDTVAPYPVPGVGSLPEVGRSDERRKGGPLVRIHRIWTPGLRQAVRISPESYRRRLHGYSISSPRKSRIETGWLWRRNTNGFDQQRFVPFIYADITEHVKFASEIEIEHGIRETGDNEISLEFAHIDYLVNEPFNIRAGILLVPIGKFNLLHDSPLNDLTDRPLVSQLIIPSTMSETGVGFYGTLYPGRTSKLDYEFYVTTGPCGYNQDGSPRVNEANGTRNSRQRKCASDDGLDINNGKAVSGRVAFSPMLGVEIAGSSYYGNQSPTKLSTHSASPPLTGRSKKGHLNSSAKQHGLTQEETPVPFQGKPIVHPWHLY